MPAVPKFELIRNYAYFWSQTDTNNFRQLTPKKDIQHADFNKWRTAIVRLVKDHPYSTLSPAHMGTFENHYVIGLAYLLRLRATILDSKAQLVDEGTVGTIRFDQDMKKFFNQLVTSKNAKTNINGMIYSVETSVSSYFTKIFNERGALQLGSENCNTNLQFRKERGSAYFVKEKCITFACNDARENYTPQWLATIHNLSTFSLFTKKIIDRSAEKCRHSVIITACDFNDAKLIGKWFQDPPKTLPDDTTENKPATSGKIYVLFYFPVKLKKLDMLLRRASKRLSRKHPEFTIYTKYAKDNLGPNNNDSDSIPTIPYPKHYNKFAQPADRDRFKVEDLYNFAVAPCGSVMPIKDAVSVTTPINLNTEKEPDNHHIEILGKICDDDFFKFCEEIIENMKLSEATDNHEFLSFRSSLEVITSKYESIKSKSNDWFIEVVDFVSKKPHLAVLDKEITVTLDEDKKHNFTIDPYTIGMVCLYNFKEAACEIKEDTPGTIGNVNFNKYASNIFMKLKENRAADQRRLQGMLFIAEQNLQESIIHNLVQYGAIQLATELSSKKKSQEDLIKERKERGSAYFVAKRGVCFAINVSNDNYTEQFVATKLNLCTFTWFHEPGYKKLAIDQSFTITASVILDLKIVSEGFLTRPRISPEKNMKLKNCKVLFFLGDEYRSLELMFIRSASRLEKTFECDVEICNNKKVKYDSKNLDVVIHKKFDKEEKEKRRSASEPYTKEKRVTIDKEYDFIIAPADWVRPSDNQLATSIIMPVEIKVAGEWLNYFIEIICQNTRYDPFDFAQLFTKLMEVESVDVPHRKFVKNGFEEIGAKLDAILLDEEKTKYLEEEETQEMKPQENTDS